MQLKSFDSKGVAFLASKKSGIQARPYAYFIFFYVFVFLSIYLISQIRGAVCCKTTACSAVQGT